MKIASKQIRKFGFRGLEDKTSYITMALSSETPVDRHFGREILSHDPDSIDFSRALPNGLPIIVAHDDGKLPIGRLKNLRLDSDRVLRGDAYFSGREEAQQIRQDILDGIITDTSVGYRILDYKVQKAERKEDPNTFLATRWMPLECSLVVNGADGTVGVGRSLDDDAELDLEVEEADGQEEPQEEALEASEAPAPSQVDPNEQGEPQMDPGLVAQEDQEEERKLDPEDPEEEAEDSEDLEEERAYSEPTLKVEAEEEAEAAKAEEKDQEEEEEKEAIEDSGRALTAEKSTRKELPVDEVIALRSVAVKQGIKTEDEIDSILVRSTSIDEARKLLIQNPTETVIFIKENTRMTNAFNSDTLYRGLKTAIQGGNDWDSSLNGVITRKSPNSFEMDLFGARADSWAGDTVANNMTTSQAGATSIYQENIGVLPLLRARSVVLAAGAHTRVGNGSMSYLRQTVATVPNPMAEDSGSPVNSNIDFVKVPYLPHALTIKVILSEELQKESIVDLQAKIREDMSLQMGLILDNYAINGVTTPYTVNGLLSAATGIQTANLTTAGVPTFAAVNALKAKVDRYAVNLTKCAYITDPDLFALLETTSKFSGGMGFPIADSNKINGYNALTTTHVPVSSGDHTLIFGDFSNLEICFQGPTVFMTDVQTRFDEGITILTARQYFDIGILQPNAFASCNNFTLS